MDNQSLRQAITDTAQAIAAATEWRDIASAPKDGTSVWILHDDMLCIGCFIPESRYTSGGWRVQAKIRRSETAERWAYGDVVSLEFCKGHPVKWLPLPPHPAREGI